MIERMCHVPAEDIYAVTGIQFLPINTLVQLYAARLRTPRLLEAASTFVTIPDLLNYWLTGRIASEYTNATTTQFVMHGRGLGARTCSSGWDCRHGCFRRSSRRARSSASCAAASAALGGVPVVAPACHDTGSAVAAIAAGGRRAFLSSGTWSLLGTEVPAPVISQRSRELNFTNEGGVSGTTRLLKNIAGMWLLQACRRDWAAAGSRSSTTTCLPRRPTSATRSRCCRSGPPLVPASDGHACGDRRVLPRHRPAGAGRTARLHPGDPREPRVQVPVRDRVARRAHRRTIDELQIVGGGARNRLLNQFTADATGCTVIAGPVEATALGNIAMQMVATGAGSLGRRPAHHRTLVSGRAVRAERTGPLGFSLPRFVEYLELTCV
jgi:rhamnulokinase